MKKLILLMLLALSATIVAAIDLSDYPSPFVINGVSNFKIVVGKNAATSDVIGAIDIAAALISVSDTDIKLGRVDSLFDSHIGILDIDANSLGTDPMIVVGGPCINSVAAELLDYPIPCHADFEIGKAYIRYFPEKKAILVAGYEAQETLAASYVVSDYADYHLRGEQMEVSIIGEEILAIIPV